MRRALALVVAAFLVAWIVVGSVEAISVATKACAEAASEITDPCTSKAAYLFFYALVWLTVAMPLGYTFAALRRRRP